MGTVYAGYHLRLRRAIAVKVLRPEYAKIPEFQIRFEREARASARLKSKSAVRVFDVGASPEGVTYIVMEVSAHAAALAPFGTGRTPLHVTRASVEATTQPHAKSLALETIVDARTSTERNSLDVADRDRSPDGGPSAATGCASGSR